MGECGKDEFGGTEKEEEEEEEATDQIYWRRRLEGCMVITI